MTSPSEKSWSERRDQIIFDMYQHAADARKAGYRDIWEVLYYSAEGLACQFNTHFPVSPEQHRKQRKDRRELIIKLLREEPRTFNELIEKMGSPARFVTIKHMRKAVFGDGYQACCGHAEYKRAAYEPGNVRNDLYMLMRKGLVVAVDLDEGSRARKMYFIKK